MRFRVLRDALRTSPGAISRNRSLWRTPITRSNVWRRC